MLAGSFHETGPDDEHTYNTMPLFDRTGALAGAYRKIHLYDVEIPGRVSYQESRDGRARRATWSWCPSTACRSGCRSATTCASPSCTGGWPIAGAQVLVVPAAFMLHTGRDHWEVLLRARAIENQCYVLAAGQIGDHDPGRTCFGRSMVIDPWGTVVAQMPDEVGVVTADLDLGRLERDPPGTAEPGEPPASSARHADHARAPITAPRPVTRMAVFIRDRPAPGQPHRRADHEHDDHHAEHQLPERQEQAEQRVGGDGVAHAAIQLSRGPVRHRARVRGGLRFISIGRTLSAIRAGQPPCHGVDAGLDLTLGRLSA